MSLQFRIITAAVLLPLLFLSGQTYGQKNITKIYLKDGKILEGRVIVDNDRYVELIKLSNDTIQVGYKLISSVGKPPKIYKVKRDKIIKKSGIAITAIGNNLYDFELSQEFFSPQLTISKRIHQGKFNLGIALGYDQFDFISNFTSLEGDFLSTAIYGRYYLNQRKTRFLIDGKIGYAFKFGEMEPAGFTHEYNGEMVSALGMGIHLPSSQKISLLIRAGVNHLKTSGVFTFNFRGGNSTAYSRKLIHPYIGLALEF